MSDAYAVAVEVWRRGGPVAVSNGDEWDGVQKAVLCNADVRTLFDVYADRVMRLYKVSR
jgi:hypothetical protein